MSPLSLDDTPRAVADYLDTYFLNATTQAQAIHPDYGRAWSTVAELAQSGGKKLRPYMLCLTYEAYTGTIDPAIIPIAAAHELLHLSLLIHDDIIDRDDVRYGVKNITGRYLDYYYDIPDGDRRHFAESAALLAGDIVLSAAHQAIVRSECSAEQKITALSLLGDGIFEVCGGELLDTEAAFKPFADTNAELIARYKTASYSCIAPLVTGAALANAPANDLETLRIIAVQLGVAYQLTDDLLGCFGNETVTGKTTLGDIREGKHTYLIEQHLALTDDTDLFERIFGNADASAEEVHTLQQQLISSGAKARTEQYIDKLATAASEAIATLSIPETSKRRLGALIARATRREN